MNALIVPVTFGILFLICLAIIWIERWMTPSHAKGWIEPYHEHSLSKRQRIFFDGMTADGKVRLRRRRSNGTDELYQVPVSARNRQQVFIRDEIITLKRVDSDNSRIRIGIRKAK